MEQFLKGDAGGQAADRNVEHVERGDALRRTVGEATFEEKEACAARAPELDLDEARQWRAEWGADGRADRDGQAGGADTDKQDV